MFQSVQSKDDSAKKNNDSEKKAPGVDYAQMMQLQTEQSRSDLATQMKESSPAQFMVEEPSFAVASEGKEEVQAKLNSSNPVQMQEEEEELQAKLSDNAPTQMQEEEEELQAKLNSSNPVQMQEEEEELQAKLSNNVPAQLKEDAANSVASASSGTTTSLPKDVNTKMENSFGTSFAGVNIHKNSEKATQLSALAYTQGNDVHFAPGQYNPSSTKGQELIGHELTHVVQQRAGRVKGTQNKGGMNVNTDKGLENEADVMGARAAAGQGVDVSGVGSGVQLMNEPRKRKTKHAQGDFINRGNRLTYITAIYTKRGESYSGDKFDTYWSISRRCGVSVDKLRELNPDLDENNLLQGQAINISKGKEKRKKTKPVPYFGYGPTKPRLYWDDNPKIELALYGKDLERTIIYKTEGIHSNDDYWQLAQPMYVAHTYGETDYWESSYTESFYYFDNGIKKWVSFDPCAIGWSAEEATNIALIGIGSAVGGLILLESGLVVLSVRQVLANASLETLNQYIIQGADFGEIDWANVAASGFLKNKHVKNIVAAAFDYTINSGGADKHPVDVVVEFLVRTGADALFTKFKRTNSDKWNEKMGGDLLKKVMRAYVMNIYKEMFGSSDKTEKK